MGHAACTPSASHDLAATATHPVQATIRQLLPHTPGASHDQAATVRTSSGRPRPAGHPHTTGPRHLLLLLPALLDLACAGVWAPPTLHLHLSTLSRVAHGSIPTVIVKRRGAHGRAHLPAALSFLHAWGCLVREAVSDGPEEFSPTFSRLVAMVFIEKKETISPASLPPFLFYFCYSHSKFRSDMHMQCGPDHATSIGKSSAASLRLSIQHGRSAASQYDDSGAKSISAWRALMEMCACSTLTSTLSPQIFS